MIDLNKYSQFVQAITSEASNNLTTLQTRMDAIDANYNPTQDLYGPDVNVPLLLTSAMGMCGEAGEFSEILKKVLFHGKELNEEVHQHMVKELGDVQWYWINACRALNVDPNEVITRNVDKLRARYPGGAFSIEASQTRAQGDI